MAMPYLHCGRCGLQIKIQAEYLRLENCPRCLARSKALMPLVLSANRVDPAVGYGWRTEEPPRDYERPPA
jgi:hypothetical protein